MFPVYFTPLSFPSQYGFQFEMTFICEGVFFFLNVCLPTMPKSCLFAHFYSEPNSRPGIYSNSNQMNGRKYRVRFRKQAQESKSLGFNSTLTSWVI